MLNLDQLPQKCQACSRSSEGASRDLPQRGRAVLDEGRKVDPSGTERSPSTRALKETETKEKKKRDFALVYRVLSRPLGLASRPSSSIASWASGQHAENVFNSTKHVMIGLQKLILNKR